MINAILTGLFSFINGVFTPIFSPLDALIIAVIPDITSYINLVYQFINTICDTVTRVISILPISFINILGFICDTTVIYLGAVLGYHTLTFIFHAIRNIKIW